jgi:hypothetical protein
MSVVQSVKQNPKFMAQIDNLAYDVKEAKELVILPVYGHGEIQRSDPRPLALFQFINKLDFKPIS